VGLGVIAVVLAILVVGLTLGASVCGAAPVTVRFPENAAHGFLILRSEGGETLAAGELLQVPHGDGVESRLVFRFKDGSLYDETVTFSQRKVFRLLAYRLIQRGPSYPRTTEVSFDRQTGRYRARTGDSGADSADGTLDLPEDVHNGMTGMLVKNLAPGASAAGHLLVFTPKPRLLKTEFHPEGEDRFFVGDVAHMATRYLVTMKIGGLTGVLARWLGKDPPDGRYWISTGPAPAFVKFRGAMYAKGPRWRIELGTPRWPAER
jgi:hypothetical protein